MSRRRIALWACALLLAGCLYFFENGTGTRIVLACALLLPLFPALRRALFTRDREAAGSARTLFLSFFRPPEEEEPGDVRPYRPGDPLNRIHWKLSAKRDELLVRPPVPDNSRTEAAFPVPSPSLQKTVNRRRRLLLLLPAGVFLLLLLLLVLLPDANRAFRGVLNRLFTASEQVNAYAYERFPVPAGQPLWPAFLLLGGMLAAFLAVLLVSGSRLAALLLAAAIVIVQVYLGLSLPSWCHVALFTLFALWMARRPPTQKDLLLLLSSVLVLSLAVVLFLPGTHAATEEASERVRDALSRVSEQWSGSVPEAPDGEKETRHVHTRSLAEGDREAGAEKEYRLVTREEEQVSMPRWIDWVKVILLSLGAVALLVLPFLPFAWLNARRKKALEAREAFRSGDTRLAVQSAFQHVIAWLEAADRGAGNVPYRDWAEPLSRRISGEYAALFRPCAALFEQAAYSEHPLSEADRARVLSLLEETERILRSQADRKQRFRLKYVECLWV